jgi:hypothetical protein
MHDQAQQEQQGQLALQALQAGHTTVTGWEHGQALLHTTLAMVYIMLALAGSH